MKEKILGWHLEIASLQVQRVEFHAAILCWLAAIPVPVD